jgi:hypothetical protein
MSFSASAKELEMMGKAGDLSAAAGKVESLGADFDQVARALKGFANEP